MQLVRDNVPARDGRAENKRARASYGARTFLFSSIVLATLELVVVDASRERFSFESAVPVTVPAV